MSESSVLLSVASGVATVTFNRPQVFNAFDRAMAGALVETLQHCTEERAIRAVILTGNGGGFSAGGDIKALRAHLQAGGSGPDYFRDTLAALHRIILGLRGMPKPVIAAINGATGGAGISLAAACDLRLAAARATFKQAYTTLGLTPDGGWTALLPPLIGAAKAMELLLLDPVLSAEEARAIGLVHEVVPDGDLMRRANEVAARLADGPTQAYAGAKALLNAAVFPALEAQLEREREGVMAQSGTLDFIEGLNAFVEKREAHFTGE